MWPADSFELLDMLKAHKKAIRRAAVNTFGYIAKAIGPQDVLATLLNNLKVQERQNRVCTTVAIGRRGRRGPGTGIPACERPNQLRRRRARPCGRRGSAWTRTAIVAETCGPYTVLPAVMNEYRVPELNVQNGVLKVRWPARAEVANVPKATG